MSALSTSSSSPSSSSSSSSLFKVTGMTAAVGLVCLYSVARLLRRTPPTPATPSCCSSSASSSSSSATSSCCSTASVASSSSSSSSITPDIQPLIICGPSGVGKGTLLKRLLSEFPAHFGKTISHTTRAPRTGEINGKAYHFTTRVVMDQQIADGEFLESAEVHGNVYGTSVTSVHAVTESGRICILEIDVQGAATVKRQFSKAHTLFIRAPSMQALRERLMARGTESEDTIKTRMATAEREMRFYNDHPSFFEKTVINDNLDVAHQDLRQALFSFYPQLQPNNSTSTSTQSSVADRVDFFTRASASK